MIIIPLKDKYTAQTAELYKALLFSIKEDTGDIYFNFEKVNLASIKAFLKNTITLENKQVYIALEGEEVIGVASGEILPCFLPFSQVKETGYLSGAYVKKEHRRKGVMRALETEVTLFFKAKGVAYQELNIITNNGGAEACWQSLGYTTFRSQMRKAVE